MSASQRRKGKGGELEVVTIAKKHGLDARRTWENATAGDAIARRTDVVIGSKKLQVKRRKRAWNDLYSRPDRRRTRRVPLGQCSVARGAAV